MKPRHYRRIARELCKLAGVRKRTRCEFIRQSFSRPEAHLICVPRVTDGLTLFAVAHECAHVFHSHTELDYRTRLKNEWQATKWAFKMMPEHGVPISPEITQLAKDCMLGHTLFAESEGVSVPLHLTKFVKDADWTRIIFADK